MTIYSAVKMGDVNGDTCNGSLSTDSHTHNVLYTVFTDDITDEFHDIKDADGLPQLYEELSDTGIRVKSYSYKKRHPVTRADGKTGALWEITVNYEIDTTIGLSLNGVEPSGFNARLLSFALDFNAYEITCEQAYTKGTATLAVPIINSAQQDVEPKLKDVKYTTVLRWTQIEDSTFDYTNISSYIGTINTNALSICGKNIPGLCGKFRKIQPTYKYNTVTRNYYFETSYEVEINDDTWLQKPKDQGFKQRSGSSLVYILNKDINPVGTTYKKAGEADEVVTEPAPLYANGAVIPLASQSVNNLHYLEFQTCKAISWGGLNLVSSLY